MQSKGGKGAREEFDPRYRRRFALFPKRMKSGRWIWLKYYRRLRSPYD